MKKLIVLLFLFACLARGAEPVFVTVDTTAHPAIAFGNAAALTVSGVLFVGGFGDQPAPPDWAGKIILMDRGQPAGSPKINFAEKAKRATAAGAIALIIANHEAGPANDGTLEPETAPIPVMSVSRDAGAVLKTKAGSRVRVGTRAPPIAPLPDPTDRKGEVLMSDGTAYVLSKFEGPPSLEMSSEISAGQRLAFVVTSATGSPQLAYQWIKDGVNIAGATAAQFVIAAVKLEDAGTYLCQVSNQAGAASSAPHNVTIK